MNQEDLLITKEDLDNAKSKRDWAAAVGGIADAMGGGHTAGEYFTGKFRPQGPSASQAMKPFIDGADDDIKNKQMLLQQFRQQKELSRTSAEENADSAESARMREMVGSISPGLAGKMKGLSARQIREAFPILKERIEMDKTLAAVGQKAPKGFAWTTGDNGERALAPTMKPLPADKVLSVNEGNNIPRMLEDIDQTVSGNKDMFGPVAGRLASINPYNERAQSMDAQMRATSQAFGRLMEGGVLRKEDEEKYRKMFPQLSDTPQVAANKLQIVKRLMAQKQNADVNALRTSGYDVSGVDRGLSVPDAPAALTRGPANPSHANAAPQALPLGHEEDGYIYNRKFPPSDPRAWEKK